MCGKSDKFPETLEEYTNLTYSRDEVIGTIMGSTNTSHLTELATYRYGRCYVLEISPNEEVESHLIGFKIKKNLMVFFIDYGQELCIIYSVLHCDVLLHNVLGPKLLLPMGCGKLGEKNCVHLPSVGEQNAN